MEFPAKYTIALTQEKINTNWPDLVLGKNCAIDSLKDLPNNRYNCVAFALGERNVILDMLILSKKIDLTPCGLTNDVLIHTVDAYVTLFRHFYKFEICSSSDVEKGFTKIALYEGSDEDGDISFLHVALQLENGKWKSKLGRYEDVIHDTLEALSGDFYGKPIIYMKRPIDVVIKLFSEES